MSPEKKVPPPTSDGREGRLFPPEHLFSPAHVLVHLALACKLFFLVLLLISQGDGFGGLE